MKVVIKKKMSGTGTIHDLANEHIDRVITGKGRFAVVTAAYYGGKGYTTHVTEEAAIKQAERMSKQGYSYSVIDSDGNVLVICHDVGDKRLVKKD